jgi:phenylacetate-coenzyme A ligase PaaK-like adenylate-forming protein
VVRERLYRRGEMISAIRRGSELGNAHRWPRQRIERHRDERLRALVAHARSRSPFHAERLRHVDLDAPGLLERLPTMNKAAMMGDLGRVLTDPRLRELDLDSYLSGLSDDALLLGCYRVMATGGTSGDRGLFVYDRAGWVDVIGALACAPRWLGVPPRIPRPRMATIWASSPAHMTARLAASFRTPIYRRLQLAATMPIADMVNELNTFRPVWLSAYPSIAALLADEQQVGRLRIAPRVVLVSSEQCTPAMRDRITSTWGVEPFNTYATTESSVIAVECEQHTGLHVFEDLVIVEVVDGDGRPVPDGEPGNKILVTNLFNRVQPIIRYELTDLVTMAPGRCACGRQTRRIESIDGRNDDIMLLPDLTGRLVPVHPNHFAEAIESIAGIHTYQVTELAGGIEITVVCPAADAHTITDAIAAGLRQRFEPLGVADTRLQITTADAIARPAVTSGKFKLVRARPARPTESTIAGVDQTR